MTTSLAERYRSVDDQQIRVLAAVERGMQQRDRVPRSDLPSLARMPPEDVDHAVGLLNDAGLVERHSERRTRFRLTFAGYDVLAVHALAEADDVVELGGVVNEGKESEIYAAHAPDRPVVVKLHREGYSSFRDVDRTRSYADEKAHVSWIYRARQAAEREFETMSDLHPRVSVPEPVAQNRHAVVLEHVDAIEMDAVTVDEPAAVLDAAIVQLEAAWDVGYVHADVSAYNVMVAPDAVYLIDWPQAVDTDHPHARQLLERDVDNLLSYFDRTYPEIELPDEDAVVARITA